MRTLPALDHAAALAALARIRDEVEALGKTAAIAVVDAHGELVAFVRCDGALLSSGPLAINKAYTAARLNRPTRVLGETLRNRGTDVAFYGDPRYVGFGGGLPVRMGGAVAGGVGVSGLSDDDDDALAAMGVAILQGDAPTAIAV
ncbi:MAG: heme-binding protein [Betaproteobacteria bacterium]